MQSSRVADCMNKVLAQERLREMFLAMVVPVITGRRLSISDSEGVSDFPSFLLDDERKMHLC